MSATLPANLSALPDAWVDRLFARLGAMYGKHWIDLWTNVNPQEVRDTWARALARFEPGAMRRAIEHCESHLKFPPTMPEFVALCRDFRGAGKLAALPPPRGKLTEHVAAEIARLAEEVAEREHKDRRAWARKILQRAESGDRSLPHISIEYAKEALGMPA